MFLSDKPHYPEGREEEEDAVAAAAAAAAVNNNNENMMIEIIPIQQQIHHQFQPNQQNQNQQLMVLGESSGGEDHEPSTKQRHQQHPQQHQQQQQQKKRAETWVQDETRILISLRREMDGLFNTSKSNKHLWEQISAKMREKGFDRNPNMCTDKWRNLLKEFKKAKLHDNRGTGGSGKMSCYKEIEEILRDRNKTQYKNPTTPHTNNNKVDSFMHFSDKGIEDTSISFAHVEANGRPTLNLETGLDHDGHPLAMAAADAVGANGVAPWNWRETPENGGESQSYGGRVIEVTWGDYTRRIGIDGSADAIKEAIKSAFRLRTKRAFWLEDEHQIVRSLDRDMPLGNYTLHLDEGLAVKVCLYDEADSIAVHTEDKVFYTEDDFREFLTRRAWTGLREFDGYRNIENMDDLRPGAIYRGVS